METRKLFAILFLATILISGCTKKETTGGVILQPQTQQKNTQKARETRLEKIATIIEYVANKEQAKIMDVPLAPNEELQIGDTINFISTTEKPLFTQEWKPLVDIGDNINLGIKGVDDIKVIMGKSEKLGEGNYKNTARLSFKTLIDQNSKKYMIKLSCMSMCKIKANPMNKIMIKHEKTMDTPLSSIKYIIIRILD